MVLFELVMTSGVPQAQGGRRKDDDPSLIEAHPWFGNRPTGPGSSEEAMNWGRRLAVLFVILALTGCAQGVTGQPQIPSAPYSPENNGNMHDGGGGGGGGGGSM